MTDLYTDDPILNKITRTSGGLESFGRDQNGSEVFRITPRNTERDGWTAFSLAMGERLKEPETEVKYKFWPAPDVEDIPISRWPSRLDTFVAGTREMAGALGISSPSVLAQEITQAFIESVTLKAERPDPPETGKSLKSKPYGG